MSLQQPDTSKSNESSSIASSNTSSDDAIKERPFTAETRFAAGQLAESQNNPNQAVIQYNEALKLKPDYLAALYRLGVVYAELKEYPQATEIWGRYIGATGEAATAFGDLGFCEELAGDAPKAEAAYKKGIEKDPKNVTCRVNYGLMLARAGKIDAATEQWRFVLSEAEIHYNLGGLYAQQGHKDQARAEFSKALELDPKLTDAQSRLTTLDQN
ncbi:MAG: tetratricopeptide repeat protein [Tepidisphaeraceae bacterium]|jgi:tetratricopeptide (TPR) repeat protein